MEIPKTDQGSQQRLSMLTGWSRESATGPAWAEAQRQAEECRSFTEEKGGGSGCALDRGVGTAKLQVG